MNLDLSVPFHAQLSLGRFETPLSFASRVAYANGFGPLRMFCHLFGVDAKAIRSGDPATITWLAHKSGVDAAVLGRFGFSRSEKVRAAPYGAEVIKGSMHDKTPLRYCPHCICYDIESSSEKPSASAYLRGHWALNFVLACEVHRCELVTAEATGHSDFGRYVEVHLDEIERARQTSRSRLVTPGDLYFTNRALGVEQEPSPLDAFTFIQAFELSEVMGFLVEAEWTTAGRRNISAARRSRIRQGGFKIARGGADAIMGYFDARLHRKKHHTPSELYGALLSLVRRNFAHPEFAEVASRLRKHAIAHFGVKGVRMMLGEAVDVGGAITAWRAAEDHIVSSRKIVDELVKKGFVDPGACELHPAQVLLSSEAVDFVSEEMGERIDWKKACDIIGVDRTLLHQLCDEGLFRRHEHKYFKKPTTFFRSQVMDLLDRVHANAPVSNPAVGFVTVDLAAHTARCPTSQIIALVSAGHVEAVRDPARTAGLLSVMVDPAEVHRVLLGSDYFHVFDNAVKVSNRLSTALISKGLLRHPGYPDRAAAMWEHLSPVSFAELRFEYSRLREIAKIMELDVEEARAKLAAAKIEPALDGVPNCCYYRNRDLEGIM